MSEELDPDRKPVQEISILNLIRTNKAIEVRLFESYLETAIFLTCERSQYNWNKQTYKIKRFTKRFVLRPETKITDLEEYERICATGVILGKPPDFG